MPTFRNYGITRAFSSCTTGFTCLPEDAIFPFGPCTGQGRFYELRQNRKRVIRIFYRILGIHVIAKKAHSRNSRSFDNILPLFLVEHTLSWYRALLRDIRCRSLVRELFLSWCPKSVSSFPPFAPTIRRGFFDFYFKKRTIPIWISNKFADSDREWALLPYSSGDALLRSRIARPRK